MPQPYLKTGKLMLIKKINGWIEMHYMIDGSLYPITIPSDIYNEISNDIVVEKEMSIKWQSSQNGKKIELSMEV